MQQKIKQIFSNPLFAGSMVMVIGSNLSSVINYFYHLLMGRLLQPVNYGELTALISLIGLIGTLPSILGPVIIKYVSASKSKQDVTGLIIWLNKRLIIVSVAIALLVFIFSTQLATFLKIEQHLFFWVIGLTFLPSLPALMNKAVLQGLLRFKALVITQTVENMLKLLAGVSFVYLGYSTGGALVGLLLATVLGWLLSRFYIKDYLEKKDSKTPDLSFLGKYSVFVSLQAIALTSFYTTDILLVKHFMNPLDAGLYAAMSRLGQIIFFIAGPIGSVMFALASKRQSEGKRYNQIFFFSFGLTALVGTIITLIYWLLPKLIVTVLYGHNYSGGSGLLVWLGLFMSIFTLSTLTINFFLSVNKTSVVILPIFAAIIQGVGIWFYHNSLQQVIYISTASSALLLVSLFVYFVYESKALVSDSTSI